MEAAERKAAQQQARDDLAAQLKREAAEREILWRNEDGTPIDLPTVFHAFARAIDTRFGKIEVQHGQLIDSVEENTELTKKLAEDSAPVIEFAKAMTGVTKMLNYMSAIAKPLAWTVAGLCGLVIMIFGALTAVKTGFTPPK